MPLITVIVPVYKVEPYLRRCVDSILAQTIRDFELILVDDGSPDNCGAICDEYAAMDERINVIHQQNGGLSAARNAGIDWAFKSSGSEWLSFIDSDDWVHPEFLNFLLRAAEENRALVSACGFIRIDGQIPFREEEFSSKTEQWDELYIADPIVGAIAVNKLYQKSLFCNLRYPVGKLHEDEFLTYKLLYKAGLIAYVQSDLYYYYQNPNGIMNTEFSLRRLDAVEALAEQRAFAKRIRNKELYKDRTRNLASCIFYNLIRLQKSESIDQKEKKKHHIKLRHSLQKVLIRDGSRLIPLRDNRSCYETAFPKLTWLYWTSVGVRNKIKRMVKRNASN